MVEFGPNIADAIVNIRISGKQLPSELGSFSHRLVALYDGENRLNVVFDWTALKGWTGKRHEVHALQEWSQVAYCIARAAIIHRACWNQQAAILAAVLRSNQCIVRSWAPDHFGRMLQWLQLDRARPDVSTR